MFKGRNALNYICLMVGMVLILLMAACTPGVAETEEPLSTPEIETIITEEPEIEETPVVSVAPQTVVLVPGVSFDRSIFSDIESLLESLTEESGLTFVVLEEITPELVTPEIQVVIGVGSGLNFNELAANFPDVRFLAVDDPAADVALNLSLVGDPMRDTRQLAFMAGYLSALISVDYKIAAVIPANHPAQDLIGESFITGGRFYCGICQPLHPPYNAFPQWHGLDSEPAEDAFRPLLSNFDSIGDDVVYVPRDVATPELLDFLDELGIKAIGDQAPDILRKNWVGTVVMDPVPALQALWPDLIAGNPGVRTSAEIRLVDVDMRWIAEGRLRFFELVAADLQAGMISFERIP